MITGATKNKVDAIWQKMWEGGITNPLDVISNLTYLMFMRSLDEKELEAERLETMLGIEQNHLFPKTYVNDRGEEIPGKDIRWSSFKDKRAEDMYRIIDRFAFPFIKTMGDNSAFSKAMENATFGFPAGKPSLLEKAVTGVEELLADFDEHIGDLGDLYEYMLSKLSTAGTNGQFRTPKHIRDMMVKMVDPKPGELVCDPACGTAGFLISSAEHIRDVYGDDMSAEQWVLEHPESILEIQRKYVASGSNVLYAPTFGGNRQKLKERGIFNRTEEMNKALAQLSKQAADGKAWVAGDIAPTGRVFSPPGRCAFEELVDIYTEQAAGLEQAASTSTSLRR